MAHRLPLVLQDGPLSGPREVEVRRLIIAGWTGRDRAALEHHIEELEKLGVPRPASVPIFLHLSTARLTLDAGIEASGDASSGEVEFVLFQSGGRRWVGVGSDHSDRKVETYDMTVCKQMCEKPIAPVFWPYDTVAGHWDELVLKSFIHEGGKTIPYQEGSVASMLHPDALLREFGSDLPEGTMMFCGTMAAIGGIRPAARFLFELHDPRSSRVIRHGYDIENLPV
jgi:Protein of unknown function (DUF2848)